MCNDRQRPLGLRLALRNGFRMPIIVLYNIANTDAFCLGLSCFKLVRQRSKRENTCYFRAHQLNNSNSKIGFLFSTEVLFLALFSIILNTKET